jgi:tetratricopeptide (TPR) repeat protein
MPVKVSTVSAKKCKHSTVSAKKLTACTYLRGDGAVRQFWDSLEVARSLNLLGILYFSQGKYELAESVFHRAFSIREQVLGPEHLEVAYMLNNLGELYTEQGKYDCQNRSASVQFASRNRSSAQNN